MENKSMRYPLIIIFLPVFILHIASCGKNKCIQGNCLNGQGNFTSSDGSQYLDEWKNDHMHGKGTLTWPDGTKYVGEFRNDERHGQGSYIYADGSKYVGEWKKGHMYGEGTSIHPNGNVVSGIWADGELVKASPVVSTESLSSIEPIKW